jgi:hypothetical protein
MDITLSKVEGVAFIQHEHDKFNGFYNSIVIYTEKGKVTLELFGDKPLTIQLGDNE